MEYMTQEQKACPHAKWVKSGEPDLRLPNTWYMKCRDCGVMDYNYEEHYRRNPDEQPKAKTRKGISIREYERRQKDRRTKRQKENFVTMCLKNPRWWLVLIPAILISLIFLPLIFLCDAYVAGSRAVNGLRNWLNDFAKALLAPITSWSRRPFIKAKLDE